MGAADRILRYLQGTKILRIKYSKLNRTRLYSYYNIDFTGDKLMQKLVSGNVYFFIRGVISYSSKRQQTVAQLTTEVEYYSLAKAISKAL